MEFILFLIGLIWLVIYTRRQNDKAKQEYEQQQQNRIYSDGYWDGYKAAEIAHGHKPSDPNEVVARYGMPVAEPDPTEASPAVALPEATHSAYVEQPADFYDAPTATTQDEGEAKQAQPAWADEYVSTREVAPPDLAERREANRKATINIALYVASLMLVAGILLLSNTWFFSGAITFSLTVLMVFIYYVAGFVLVKRVPILKPAALAFVGTALASVPFVGVGMHMWLGVAPAQCWLLASLMGAVMYVYAAVKMSSKVLGYVSILSLFIVTMSLPAVAHAQMMWYYVLMIVFGALLTILAYKQFSWVPRVFAEPAEEVSPFVIPVALIGSLWSSTVMTPLELAAVYGAATVYYVSQALTARTHTLKYGASIAARILGVMTIVAVVADVSERSIPMMGIALFGGALANVIGSLVRLTPRVRDGHNHHEAMLWLGFGAMLAGVSMLYTADFTYAALMTAGLGVSAAVALAGMFYHRRYELLVPAVVNLTALPWVVGAGIVGEGFKTELYLVMYGGLALGAVLARAMTIKRTLYAGEAVVLYGAVGVWFLLGIMANLTAAPAWLAGWWALLAATVYLVAYIEKQSLMWAVGNGVVLGVVWHIAEAVQSSMGVTLASVAWANVVLLIASHQITRRYGNADTRLSTRIAGVAYAALVAIAAITGGVVTDVERFVVWSAVPVVLYYAFYATRLIAYLAAGNIAAILAIYFGVAVLDWSGVQSAMTVATTTFVVFGAMGLWCKLAGCRQVIVQTMWRSAYFGTFAWLLLGLPAVLADASPWWQTGWYSLPAAVLYLGAYCERQTVLGVLGNGAVLGVVASGLLAAGVSEGTTVAVTAWANLGILLAVTWLSKFLGKPILLGDTRIGTIFYAVLAAIATVMYGSATEQAAAWLALPVVLYVVAYQLRSLTFVSFANAASVVQFVYVAHMWQMPLLESMVMVVWTSLVVFGLAAVASYTLNYRSLARVMWRSMAVGTTIFAIAALAAPVPHSETAIQLRTITWSVVVVVWYVLAYVESSAVALAVGNFTTVVLVVLFGLWAELPLIETAVAVAWLGVAYYVAGHIYRRVTGRRGNVWRTMFASALSVTLPVGGLVMITPNQPATIVGCMAVLFMGAALCFEDLETKRLRYIDLGVFVATISFERLLLALVPDLHGLVYTHIWVLAVGALAYVYYRVGRRQDAKARLIIALTLLTWPILVAALGGESIYQIIFLIEHVLIVIAGLVAAYRLATLWGAIAVTFAVVYMLRGYTSILAIIVGLLVMAAVVYVIVKYNRAEREKQDK